MFVEPNPNLSNDDLVDVQTQKAVRHFRIQWQNIAGLSKSDKGNIDVISAGLFAMLGRALGKNGLLNELRENEDYYLRSLLIGMDVAGFIANCYTPEMESCDAKIASIFGGDNAVASANGFEPESLAIVRTSNGFYFGNYNRNAYIDANTGKWNTSAHLSEHAMHLYGSTDGTRFGVDGNTYTDLYVLDGFRSPEMIRKTLSPTQGGVEFYYKKLGNYEDVTLLVFHVKDFNLKKEGDRWHLGKIGGKAGDTKDYVHSHFDLLKGDVGMTGKRDRIPFADAFC